MSTERGAPQVSIVIPTRNRCALLRETLDSVRAQTYAHWEAIIVDDGSEDGTWDYLTAVSGEDPRIRFMRRRGSTPGANVCRNEGFAASTGDYVVFLDSDDCIASYCLADRVEAMEANADLELGVFSCEIFQVVPGDIGLLHNVDTREDNIDRYLLIDIPWQTTGPIWRRKTLVDLGPWDEDLLSLQDWEFHLRALIRGCKYRKFPVVDCYWRLADATRDSIGQRQSKPEHLRRTENLLYKVQVMLSETKRLDRARRLLLAGLHFWLAERWLENGSRKGCWRVWTLCRRRGLIGVVEHLHGLLLFLLPSGRVVWRLRWKLVMPRFRERYRRTIEGPATFLQVPVCHKREHRVSE
jgi:glycosyltransferase involved in cell wall biosynthesis